MSTRPDEEERLRTLASHGILDTPPEERFDRITRLAAQIFGVSTCLITLVDAHRQWFKSHYGLDVRGALPDASFGAYTLRSDDLFVVEDVLQDARFSPGSPVSGPSGIRFFAGAPLKTSEGHRLGSLCLLDAQPRSLTPAEGAVLRSLADLVEEEMARSRIAVETAREAEQVRRLEARFQHMVQNGSDVITLLDADGLIQYQSPSIARVLGYEPEALVGQNAFELMHPDDAEATREAFNRLMRTGESVGALFRFRSQGGAWVWMEVTATNLLDDPTVGGIVVNSRDVTDRKRHEARQVAVLHILEQIARRAPLPEVLVEICRFVEGQITGGLCSALLLEGTRLHHVAGPSLPPAYCAAIDGNEIGPNEGSCGAAAYRKETVVTADIAADPNWTAYRDVALRYGLQASFSTPILALDGQVLGTFAVYFRTPQEPQDAHYQVLQPATFLAGIAMESLRSERALRESEESFRALTEASNQIVWRVTPDGSSYIMDEHWGAFTGQAPEEAEGFGWIEMTHPDDRGWLLSAWKAQMKAGDSVAAEFRIRSRDGMYRWVSARTVPVYDDEGRLREFIGAATDIHDRKQAEEALRESENRYRIIVEHTGQLIYDYDVATGRVLWSGAIEETTGYAPEAFSAFGFEEWAEHIHPGDRAEALARLEEAKAVVGEYAFEYRFRDAAGRYRYIDDRSVFLPDAGGRTLRMLGIMRDVTERKQAEVQLRESEGRYRALSELVSTFAFAYAVDEAGVARLEWITDSIQDVTGYAPGDLIGSTWGHLVGGESGAGVPDRLAQVFNGATVTTELEIPRKDGEMRWYRVVVHPEWDEAQARVVHVYGAGQDITNQKRHEMELIKAKEQAEAMSRLKDTFLANMSHEFRTPLTAILGFSGVLAEETEGEMKELAELIYKGGERLSETLNSVMDLAQLESGSVRMQPIRLNLVALTQEIVEAHRREAHEKGLTLAFSASTDDVAAHLDRGAVARILTNLVSNAVKFTRQGSVTVSVGCDGPRAWIRVADTGVGISEAFLAHLFDEFMQESSGLSRSYEGSGLGLTITKRLVELMGGEIEVESVQGAGSVFTVKLPASQPDRAALEAA